MLCGREPVSGLVELVRLMILRGEVPAGGRMVELLLAERFGTSLAMVREALRQLEGDGLLIANADDGMRVVELREDDLIAALQVRAALEELSAGLAAERVRDGRVPAGALSRLSELADAAEAAARSGAAGAPADRNFHRALAALAANQPCRDALARIWDRIVVASLQSAPVCGRRRRPTAITGSSSVRWPLGTRRGDLQDGSLPGAGVDRWTHRGGIHAFLVSRLGRVRGAARGRPHAHRVCAARRVACRLASPTPP
jgi:DNA-binding GntR family transcriptional regulator